MSAAASEPVPLRPYADNVDAYLEAGWPSVVPLGRKGERNAKAPVPDGYTGYAAKIPTARKIEEWRRGFAINNIGIVMPAGVVGIDIDDYEKASSSGAPKVKAGLAQLAKLQTEHDLPPLPASPISSARGAKNASGIRFYRLPEPYATQALKSKLAADIDVIRPGHRYAAVAPSRHPETGQEYVWYARDHKRRLVNFPNPANLEVLPVEWAEFLLKGSTSGSDQASAGAGHQLDLTDEAAVDWLREHGQGELCRAMRGVLRKATAALTDESQRDGSHYDTAVSEVWALLLLVIEGHRGGRAALRSLREAYDSYAETVEGRDKTEWSRMVRQGIEKAAGVVARNEAATGEDWCQHEHGECPVYRPDLWPSPQAPLDVAQRYIDEHWTLKPAMAAPGEGVVTLRRWRGDFYHYTGTHYVVISEETLRAHLGALLAGVGYMGASSSGPPQELTWKPTPQKISMILGMLGAVDGVLVPDDVEADDGANNLVGLRNGVLDLRTRTLRPHSPKRFALTVLSFDYDPAATCEAWLDFLESLWPDAHDEDAETLLAQWFGYVISGRTNLHKILLAIGPRRSGKGTIGRVLGALAGGSPFVIAPTLTRMGGTFGLQQFIGKTLAVVGDADASAKVAALAIEDLKGISGEDVQTVQRKNRDEWTGRLGARIVLMANNVPAFLDTSGALAERLLPLRFTESFAGREDVDLTERLMAELAGIFVWALDGLDSLTEAGNRFAAPVGSAELKAALYVEFAPVQGFLDEYCERDDQAHIERGDLYAAFSEWCTEHGRTRPSAETFGRDLRSVLPRVMGRGNAVRTPDGRRVRLYYGVRLRPEHVVA